MKLGVMLSDEDEGLLRVVLLRVLRNEIDSFALKCEEGGMEFEYASDLKNRDLLLWKLSAELKDHTYYKAFVLHCELKSTRDIYNPSF